jgi:hypothetical protein
MLTLILMILGMLLMLIAGIWHPVYPSPSPSFRVHPGWLGAFFVVLGWILANGSVLMKG